MDPMCSLAFEHYLATALSTSSLTLVARVTIFATNHLPFTLTSFFSCPNALLTLAACPFLVLQFDFTQWDVPFKLFTGLTN